MRRILFIIALFVLVLTQAACAVDVPRPSGPVNDFAHVISPEYLDKLRALIVELEQKTSCEIAVAAFDSIAPYDEKEYARMIFDSWMPGKKGKDNGVLILISVKERRWRIETGYGLEGILPDGLCGDIGRNYMVPYFKQGEYGAGLYYGVAAIADIVSKDMKTELDGLKEVRLKKKTQEIPPFLYIFAPVFFFLWNLPWPMMIGLPFTLFFAAVMFQLSPILGFLVLGGYFASLVVRYDYWRKAPPGERRSFFGPQDYGGTFSGTGGGWGGGFGGGGFGGGGGGGGGAGGGW